MTATDKTRPAFRVSRLAKAIFAIAGAHGHEARIAGGAVRDWAAGVEAGEIDMAIAAPITSFIAPLRDADLKVFETGLSHGTVTVVGHGESIELTQTRVDVETDGRHAVVAFSDDWAVDASRRDFTINAMYLDEAGRLYDPLGGIDDLARGVLRFVGDPGARVAEDALRMLRYCRFLGPFGEAGIDKAAREAITRAAGEAAKLSGERVANEFRRMFGASDMARGVRVMCETGLDVAATGSAMDAGRLDFLPAPEVMASLFEDGARWIVRLAAVTSPASAKHLGDRLRLSRAETRLLTALDTRDDAETLAGLASPIWRQQAYFLKAAGVCPAAQLAVSAARAGRRVSGEQFAELARWEPPKRPVSADDLMRQGVDRGPGLGSMLAHIETAWAGSDFTMTKGELLALARERS